MNYVCSLMNGGYREIIVERVDFYQYRVEWKGTGKRIDYFGNEAIACEAAYKLFLKYVAEFEALHGKGYRINYGC